MTISNGSTITASDLNDLADNAHDTIAGVAASTRKGVFQVDVLVSALTSSMDATACTRYFTPQDDYEVVMLAVYKDGGAASRNPTVTLTTVSSDETSYIPGGSLAVTLTASGTGEESARTAYTTTTGTRCYLLKGVQYKLTVSSSSASDTGRVQGTLLLKSVVRPTRREPILARTFRDVSPLTPDDLNTHFSHLSGELDASIAQRWFHSMCILPFDAISDTDGSAEKTIVIRPPFAVDVTGWEFYAAGTDAKTITMSCDVSGVDDLSVAMTGTTTILSDTGGPFRLAANTSATFTATIPASTTLTRGWVVLHLRGDRHAGSPPTYSWTRTADGDSPDATVISGQSATSIASAATTDAAAVALHSIWVGLWRSQQVTTPGEKIWLPAARRTIDSLDGYATDGAATACTFTLYDEAAGSLGAASVTCSATTTLDSDTANAVGDTQPDDATTAASDYYLTGSTGSAVETAYAVLYFDA